MMTWGDGVQREDVERIRDTKEEWREFYVNKVVPWMMFGAALLMLYAVTKALIWGE